MQALKTGDLPLMSAKRGIKQHPMAYPAKYRDPMSPTLKEDASTHIQNN